MGLALANGGKGGNLVPGVADRVEYDVTLSALLTDQAVQGQPVRVGLIGAGKYGTTVLAQLRHAPGIHLAGLADADSEKGPTALALAQWPPIKAVARSLNDALDSGATWVTTDPFALMGQAGLDLIIEATPEPQDSLAHALTAIQAGLHVIMVNLAADLLAGPYLSALARDRGVIYSLAYGDRPAQICDLIDWAETCGFEVAAAGRGVSWLPGFERTTPDTVWSHLGLTPDRARAAGMNGRVFTSFIDGTRAALELGAVVNASTLSPPASGLICPPCGSGDLARVMKPNWDGGRLDGQGVVEAVSAFERDGRKVALPLQGGVFVTFRTPSDHSAQMFGEYAIPTDDSGTYAARWRPVQFGAMEMAMSIGRIALMQEATARPNRFAADVVAVAKTDLKAGLALDGVGGFHCFGRLLPAAAALANNLLPIGLTHGARLTRAVEAGKMICWDDVDLSAVDEAAELRRMMQIKLTPPPA